MTRGTARDHGGGLDAARARWGGAADDWIDLSTGINPEPYPLPPLTPRDWQALPDHGAQDALIAAARRFWSVPDDAGILAAPGASALIARMPLLAPAGPVHIPGPTYNEHAAAFRAHGRDIVETRAADPPSLVVVSPNNPDGRLWTPPEVLPRFLVVDESFADVAPGSGIVELTRAPGRIVLKSFGKFWGLAGLRLGFAIGHPDTIAPLAEALGPWPVAGPALRIGTAALSDTAWAEATRVRLRADRARLDALMAPHGRLVGGTDLFRLYDVGDAEAVRDRLAARHIHVRIFPYSERWLRLGLPPAGGWARLEAALS